MFKRFLNTGSDLLRKTLHSVPGKETFGLYRFLPFFFLFGASLEFLMINWTAGPAKTNFCNFTF